MEYIKDTNTIIHELVSSGYMIYLGTYKDLYLEATISDVEFTLWHNLGGFNKPTKSEAIKIIDTIEEFYQLQLLTLPFRDFIKQRNVCIELYVSSGQMDLSVATKRENVIDWKISLE